MAMSLEVFFSDLLDISLNFAGDLGLDAGDCNFGFDDTKNCNLHASTHLRHRFVGEKKYTKIKNKTDSFVYQVYYIYKLTYFRNHDDFVTFLCAKTMELYYNLW